MDDPRLPGLERALKKFPKLIFIGHSQQFWFEMAKTDVTDPETRNSCPFGPFVEGRVPELMRQYPNLYCDLSANSGQTALLRDPTYGLAFVKEFQDRLMFGTDWMFREDAPCHFALSVFAISNGWIFVPPRSCCPLTPTKRSASATRNGCSFNPDNQYTHKEKSVL